MSRHLRHLFVITVILYLPAFVLSTFVSPASALTAQDQAATTDQGVSRVIKLRSNEPIKAPTPLVNNTQSSRTERMARRPAKLPDPTQIQFEEITLPQGPKPMIPMQNQSSSQPVQSSQVRQAPLVDRQIMPTQNQPMETSAPVDWEVEREQTTPAVVTTMAPQIATKIMAPKFVNLNESLVMKIQLQNVSRQSAQNIKLIATLPTHAKFASARPQPTKVDGQTYEFLIHKIDARQLRDIQIELVPNEKRPIEIVTQIQIVDTQNFAVSVRQPSLHVDISGPEQANTGQWVEHTITVENTGDGIAENIQLDRKLPPNLQVEQGKQEFFVPSLGPGEASVLTARTYCEEAGEFELGFEIKGRKLEAVSSVRRLQVFQPELEVAAVWPNMNFVNRDGIYSIQIDNTGHVDITNVQLNLSVPEGFEITTVSRQATVDSTTGALVWLYESLPAETHETIQLKATTKTPGRQICNLTIRSNETEAEKIELITEVATRADVSINLSNQGGPIEVGAKTEFVFSVVNNGSGAATDVEVQVELNPSLMPVTRDGYYVNEIDNSIRFDSIEIQPGESKELRFGAVGVTTGEHIVRGVVTMNGSKRRLIAEDSVYVFEVDQSRVSESLKPTIKRK